MKNSIETRLGIFVAVIALSAVFILDIVGGLENFKSGYHISALFNNAQELKVGDRVKMAGVEIGRVEEIKLRDNKVVVTMKIHKDAGVKTDSTATVKFTGLMGQNFVAIDFGSKTAPVADDTTVLAANEQADLSSLMAKLDSVASGVENLTKSFTGDKIDNLLGPFTDFLKANREPLTATIAHLQSISSQISEGKGTVGRLIFDDALYSTALNTVSNLQSAGEEIKATVTDARKVIGQINSGQGTIGKLVKEEKLYNETTESMTNLKEILQKINQGQGTVGKLINDQDFLRDAKLTLQKLDKATEGLEDQGPMSVLGIMINSLL